VVDESIGGFAPERERRMEEIPRRPCSGSRTAVAAQQWPCSSGRAAVTEKLWQRSDESASPKTMGNGGREARPTPKAFDMWAQRGGGGG